MTCEIGDELDQTTAVLSRMSSQDGIAPRILDLGMAPGGFTSAVLARHPTAIVKSISLPHELGGLRVMLPRHLLISRVEVEYGDLTLFAGDMGIDRTSVPVAHPDSTSFCFRRPFFEKGGFDLIICGATIQRAHDRAEYRESCERLRLKTSQLVIALQRLCDGGSLVVVLHRIESWETIELIHAFTQFSKVCLFKSQRKHAIRSAFYMVATDVRSSSSEALSSIELWQKRWQAATLGSKTYDQHLSVDEDRIRHVLEDFGPHLVSIAEPIWNIQANAIRKAPFLRGQS